LYHTRGTSLKEHFASLLNPSAIPKSHSDFLAVKNLTTTITAGERIGIIGHNGAGKSTLLKTLCNIYEPSEGHLTITGRIAPLLEVGAGFHPEFTGRENIYFNGTIMGYSKKELAKIEPEVIAFAELEEFIDTPVKYYSTGMYMRLAFSLATAVHPDILILDEMFAGGDASFVTRAKARMHSMIDRASIMIMVSHDAELMRTLCTRVLWMDHGVLIADGEPNAIVDRYLAGATHAAS
jgi:ABC-type polysaccharide/polyol phosphate transport system ATPase subunit